MIRSRIPAPPAPDPCPEALRRILLKSMDPEPGAALSVGRRTGRGSGGVPRGRSGEARKRRRTPTPRAAHSGPRAGVRTTAPAAPRQPAAPTGGPNAGRRRQSRRQALQPLRGTETRRVLVHVCGAGARLHRLCGDIERGSLAAWTATGSGYPRRAVDRSGCHLEPLGGYLEGQSRRRWRYSGRAVR